MPEKEKSTELWIIRNEGGERKTEKYETLKGLHGWIKDMSVITIKKEGDTMSFPFMVVEQGLLDITPEKECLQLFIKPLGTD
jgi:hypothetical protein